MKRRHGIDRAASFDAAGNATRAGKQIYDKMTSSAAAETDSLLETGVSLTKPSRAKRRLGLVVVVVLGCFAVGATVATAAMSSRSGAMALDSLIPPTGCYDVDVSNCKGIPTSGPRKCANTWQIGDNIWLTDTSNCKGKALQESSMRAILKGNPCLKGTVHPMSVCQWMPVP